MGRWTALSKRLGNGRGCVLSQAGGNGARLPIPMRDCRAGATKSDSRGCPTLNLCSEPLLACQTVLDDAVWHRTRGNGAERKLLSKIENLIDGSRQRDGRDWRMWLPDCATIRLSTCRCAASFAKSTSHRMRLQTTHERDEERWRDFRPWGART